MQALSQACHCQLGNTHRFPRSGNANMWLKKKFLTALEVKIYIFFKERKKERTILKHEVEKTFLMPRTASVVIRALINYRLESDFLLPFKVSLQYQLDFMTSWPWLKQFLNIPTRWESIPDPKFPILLRQGTDSGGQLAWCLTQPANVSCT